MATIRLDVMNKDATVSAGQYSQFLLYDGTSTLTPIEGPDEDAAMPSTNILATLMRFISNLFKMLSKLFNSEISLKA